jgi:hypothetical protein
MLCKRTFGGSFSDFKVSCCMLSWARRLPAEPACACGGALDTGRWPLLRTGAVCPPPGDAGANFGLPLLCADGPGRTGGR